MEDSNVCYFCGSDKIRIPNIMIFFAIAGRGYSFCRDCLTETTADKFWEKMFTSNNLMYPPRLINENKQKGEYF